MSGRVPHRVADAGVHVRPGVSARPWATPWAVGCGSISPDRDGMLAAAQLPLSPVGRGRARRNADGGRPETSLRTAPIG
jgi:hypothetical protein